MIYKQYIVIYNKPDLKVFDMFPCNSDAWKRIPSVKLKMSVDLLYGSDATWCRLDAYRLRFGLSV